MHVRVYTHVLLGSGPFYDVLTSPYYPRRIGELENVQKQHSNSYVQRLKQPPPSTQPHTHTHTHVQKHILNMCLYTHVHTHALAVSVALQFIERSIDSMSLIVHRQRSAALRSTSRPSWAVHWDGAHIYCVLFYCGVTDEHTFDRRIIVTSILSE